MVPSSPPSARRDHSHFPTLGRSKPSQILINECSRTRISTYRIVIPTQHPTNNRNNLPSHQSLPERRSKSCLRPAMKRAPLVKSGNVTNGRVFQRLDGQWRRQASSYYFTYCCDLRWERRSGHARFDCSSLALSQSTRSCLPRWGGTSSHSPAMNKDASSLGRGRLPTLPMRSVPSLSLMEDTHRQVLLLVLDLPDLRQVKNAGTARHSM